MRKREGGEKRGCLAITFETDRWRAAAANGPPDGMLPPPIKLGFELGENPRNKPAVADPEGEEEDERPAEVDADAVASMADDDAKEEFDDDDDKEDEEWELELLLLLNTLHIPDDFEDDCFLKDLKADFLLLIFLMLSSLIGKGLNEPDEA